MKFSGNDIFGLPMCGNKEQEKVRHQAMKRYNKNIREQNRNIERANELRYYKKEGTITTAQTKKLSYLESQGY